MEYVRMAEAARELNVRRQAIFNRIKARTIKHKIIGGIPMIPRTVLDEEVRAKKNRKATNR